MSKDWQSWKWLRRSRESIAVLRYCGIAVRNARNQTRNTAIPQYRNTDRLLWISLILAFAGCSSKTDFFPDQLGNTWTYDVRTGFGAQHVEDARITKRLSVAGADGFEISGPLGTSRFAWKRDVLWAETFSNVKVQPPIPLFRADLEQASWQGMIKTAFGEEKAKATLTHKKEDKKIGGRQFETVMTELRIDRPLGQTILQTWFAKGVGIIRQEQRTRGEYDLRIEWVAGPAVK